MGWSDNLMWSIRPDCTQEAADVLAGRGLHRDNLWANYTSSVARMMDMDELPIDMHGAVAVVSVVGVLVDFVNPFTANYPLLQAAFEKLREDDAVKAVIVRFKTPGGTVSHLAECAAALDQLSGEKLTIGQNDGGCYSAGYFLACHCGEICSAATDHIGNIGTVSSLVDFSEAFKESGLRRVTSKTGAIKGLGIFGDPITDAQQAFLQHMVDEHFAEFRAAVMTGRGMNDQQFAAVSDGRWWLGREAVQNGIIDRVATFNETLAAVQSAIGI